ncbi:MAG TPA: hypothetical protein VK364_02150, partial [Hymenobacter sp.]|nr:hypothetical protein [Hymenobacter sp.]
MATLPYLDRDLSWLSFNERVLDEAHDPAVPLASRVRFMAIFSANRDEFFRVRVDALRTLARLRKKHPTKNPFLDPEWVLTKIAHQVDRQQQRFDTLFEEQIAPALKQANVVLYRDEPLAEIHRLEAAAFFRSTVLAYLQPVFVGSHRRMKRRDKLPLLDSQALYFALTLRPKSTADEQELVMAYLNIPKDKLPRFIELSPLEGVSYFVFLDDIIRANLSVVFPGYLIQASASGACFSFKLNRGEDMSIQDEYRGNLVKKIKHQLAKRKTGQAVRFLYDHSIPPELLARFVHLFRLDEDDLMAGGRYHSLSDLMKLPLAAKPGLPPLPKAHLEPYESLFAAIGQQDRLLHFPYQSYSYVLRFFNEAAIDPLVYDIQVAFYRIAADSLIANALMSAAHNGKRVTVFVEVKARFDEANNL